MRTTGAVVCAMLVIVIMGAPAVVWGDTYTVTTTADSGTGTLRWAIGQANSHEGADVITFSAAMSGRTIKPASQLPVLSSPDSTIDGDLNDDKRPDVAIDGQSAISIGLYIVGANCVVEGLALMHFSSSAIQFAGNTGCQVKNCYLGVDLTGTKARRNGFTDIWISGGGSHVIGGAGGRNLFTCGEGWSSKGSVAIRIVDSSNNQVVNNYFGLERTGVSVIGSDGYGVYLQKINSAAANNIVRNNVFVHNQVAVVLNRASNNTVQGNLFGLAADGETARTVGTGIVIANGAQNNRIGGTTSKARNVFGAMDIGVFIYDPGTSGNRVMGNYFGTNEAGTKQRYLDTGVFVASHAGAQTIGGDTPEAGNVFAVKSDGSEAAIWLVDCDGEVVIRNNRIGVRPNGSRAQIAYAGIQLDDTKSLITDNLIARCTCGIRATQPATCAEIYRNVFRGCTYAVSILGEAVCRLGNLHNARTDDDGGNDFYTSNQWAIWNQTVLNVGAEGNNFHTTVQSEIEAKIMDRRDNPSYGRVDFIPLAGGVIPTGETERALAIAGLTAVPMSGGAEIAFSLSAPARVTVIILNMAGRPVAAVVVDRLLPMGLQRVLWNKRIQAGTIAPPGRYLARIVARSDAGETATGVTVLDLTTSAR